MKNASLTILPKTLLTIAIGMLLSVNAWAQEPKSVERDSKEWTAVRKHVDTKSITTYAGTNDKELLAEIVAHRTSK
ncbi:MAG: hypothetical protein NT163_09785 [Chlorobiales bacterium]|nr:hypothetical protein [Chlorobiales bacterium]